MGDEDGASYRNVSYDSIAGSVQCAMPEPCEFRKVVYCHDSPKWAGFKESAQDCQAACAAGPATHFMWFPRGGPCSCCSGGLKSYRDVNDDSVVGSVGCAPIEKPEPESELEAEAGQQDSGLLQTSDLDLEVTSEDGRQVTGSAEEVLSNAGEKREALASHDLPCQLKQIMDCDPVWLGQQAGVP